MRSLGIGIVALVFSAVAAAAGAAPLDPSDDSDYSPNAREDFPMQVFWGDTHVHSAFSMDASLAGNTRLTPADAYRFARGEGVRTASGKLARLDRPLDFLVVSDHAEYMGLLPKLRAGDPQVLADATGKRLFDAIGEGVGSAQAVFGELIVSLMKNEPIFRNESVQRGIWDEITAVAEEHDAPGVFSALIGFEWTSMPRGDNLHRVVVYADGAEKARQLIPVSAFDGDRPEDLWAFLEKYESETGGRILAIPHNANVSNGRMFAVEDSGGAPFDRSYALRRARWEPLVEVTQIKGDGETHPLLSPDDEFADFETWDEGNLAIGATLPKREGMLRYEYARSALQLGLTERARIGVNPFQFGMIGSTDAHTSFATAAEDNFWGKVPLTEPGTDRTRGVFFESAESDDFDVFTWQQVASGYAAVWAHENTRASLFDAMRRKEVYATTGPRMTVRFFGGWDYEPADVLRPHVARTGYRKGVPMGGDLPARTGESSSSPSFLVLALKDPSGAKLDRIQIVKGWRAADGELHEKVYDVAASDGREIGLDARTKPLRSTVDVAAATYTNDVGAGQLATVWRDPDFDPAESAFYYARVLEIWTPRWTAYDAARLGARIAAGTPMQLQDRAYTSPIWYQP